MCLYWRRILDALIIPAVAIYMQSQPEKSSSIIGFNHFTLQHQDNTFFNFWKFNDPSTWQLDFLSLCYIFILFSWRLFFTSTSSSFFLICQIVTIKTTLKNMIWTNNWVPLQYLMFYFIRGIWIIKAHLKYTN